jgi:rhodanese-related sulfurtransferase
MWTTETIVAMVIAGVLGGLSGSFGWTWWLKRRAVNIPVEQLWERIRKGDRFQILDVRTEREFGQGHIKGARNLPLRDLKKASEVIKNYVETVVICDTGRRSLVAYHRLKKLGFSDVKNVTGGMVHWRWPTVK